MTSIASVERQCLATKARPLWTIPASWWEPETAVHMSAWIERFVPEHERRGYIYGRP